MNKKVWLTVLMLALLCIPLGTATFAAKTTTIRFNFFGNLNEINVAKEWVKDFEAKNRNIKIDFESIGSNEISTKMLTSSAGGNAPDVTRMTHAYGQSWASKGILLDLTPYLKKEPKFYADFNQGALDIYKYDGKQYGLPHTLMCRALLYSKDLFDKAHIGYPDREWTWTKFAEAASKLTVKQNGRVIQWGFQLAPEVPGMFALFLEQAGGRFYNNQRNKVAFNTKAGVETLDFWRDLIYKYEASPSPAVGSQLNHEQAFKLGKVAMIISGPWNRPVLAKEAPNLHYGVAELPYYKERSNNFMADGIGIWAGSKNKVAAWKFVHFIMERKQQNLWWTTLKSHFPVTKSSLNYLMRKGLKKDDLALPFIKGLEYSKADTWHPKFLEVQPVLVRTFQAVLDEGTHLDPSKALDLAEKEINKVLAK
jgi:multiple sugar transport system substrate-binding protein